MTVCKCLHEHASARARARVCVCVCVCVCMSMCACLSVHVFDCWSVFVNIIKMACFWQTSFFLTHTYEYYQDENKTKTETLLVLTFILSDECWQIMVFSSASYLDSSGHFFLSKQHWSLSLSLSLAPHSLQELTSACMVATEKRSSELLFQNSEAGSKIRVEGRRDSGGRTSIWHVVHVHSTICRASDTTAGCYPRGAEKFFSYS